MEFSLIQKILIWVIPVLLAITLHEAAHAFVANYYGDDTAKSQGRMSLNPFRHIDLVGTIIIPLVLLILSNFKFTLGWAKPVPVLSHRLRKPMPHMALVALAGPGMNFGMAIAWAMLLKILVITNSEISPGLLFMVYMCRIGILINLVLAVLNLLPIPPLDGSRIVAWLMPSNWVEPYYKIEPYGILVLLVLLITGLLGKLILPLVYWGNEFIFMLLGLSG